MAFEGMQEKIRNLAKKNRLLLPGAAVILLLLALFVIRSGYSYQASLREKISSAREMYALSAAMVAESGRIEQRLEAAKAGLVKLEGGLLRADKGPVGAASLQREIKSMASRRGVVITSSRTLSFREVEGYVMIPVEFHFKSGVRQLKDLLYDIQTSPLVLDVAAIRVRGDHSREGDSLDVTMTVEGAIKKAGDAESI